MKVGDDLQALEHDKTRLVTHDRAAPSTAHLGDTVDASNEDTDVGAKNGVKEHTSLLIRPQGARARRQNLTATIARRTKGLAHA